MSPSPAPVAQDVRFRVFAVSTPALLQSTIHCPGPLLVAYDFPPTVTPGEQPSPCGGQGQMLVVAAVVKNALPQRPTAQGRLCSETEKLTSHSWAHRFPFICAALTFTSFVAKIRLFLQRFSTFLENTGFRCLQQP
ncbi:hypothetical protein GH733_016246 [Mirounga leonina]|nr:hypothetical protein GH733_016246 [Mirounga leonina]